MTGATAGAAAAATTAAGGGDKRLGPGAVANGRSQGDDGNDWRLGPQVGDGGKQAAAVSIQCGLELVPC